MARGRARLLASSATGAIAARRQQAEAAQAVGPAAMGQAVELWLPRESYRSFLTRSISSWRECTPIFW